MMSLSIPRTYANRYSLEQPIGEGAFSRTYLANDQVLQRQVAVKVLRREYAEIDEFSTRFDREAQAAARIAHPNVVPVYDFGRQDGIPYIVMQYVAGPSLKQYARDEGPLPIEESVKFIRQVLDGLAAIHDEGIVHRDVKPQNILLDEGSVAKLTDFGVAFLSQESSLTDAGTTVGTAAYMAPEQASGEAIGPRADLYAVGVILYELLTGQLPFRGDNPVQVMYRHVSELPTAPRTLNRHIAPNLEAVVLRALSKLPQDRFPDARSMRDAMLGAAPPDRDTRQSTSPVEFEPATRPQTPPERAPARQPAAPRRPVRQRTSELPRRRSRRWPVALLMVLVVALLLTSGAVVASQLGFLDADGVFRNGGSTASTDPNDDGQTNDPVGVIPDEEPTASATATETEEPEPTEEPAVEETESSLEPTPEPSEPTPTEAPADPTATPSPEPTPTEDAPAAPTAAFNEPFPGRAIPPGWENRNFETFTRDDFVSGGAYRRDDGVLYDRPTAHLYARNTGYGSTTVSFEVSDTPSSYIGILIVGMDDEQDAKVPCRVWLNDNLVWEGDSPFENEEWTSVGWRAGSLGWLEEGENTLTVEILPDEGEVGLPPWVLLTEARVYWG